MSPISPSFVGVSPLRLRVGALLEARGMTAYQLSKASDGRISMRTAYRLANGQATQVPLDVLDALVEVFELKDTGPLFEQDGRRKRRD